MRRQLVELLSKDGDSDCDKQTRLSVAHDEKDHAIITNCIGGGCGTSYIDIVQITSDVLVGDTFMLCSDGLTDMLPDSAISQILEDGGDVDELCLSAIQKGGLDNISCCLIRIK